MSDDDKPKRPKTGGRGPRAGAPAAKSLGSVRVTADELEAYTAAAAAAEQTRGDWVRDTLNWAARRVLRAK